MTSHPRHPLAVLLAVLALSFSHHPARAANILWGVNGHPIHNPVFADFDKQFEVMHQNHLTTYRLNVTLTEDGFVQAVTQTRLLVQAAKKWNITLRPVIETAFCWGDRTDSGHYPAGDQNALYQQGFERTYNFVRLFKDDIQEWEMLNEINLRARDKNDKPLSGYGWNAQEFDTPLMQDWGFVMKGISDAIARINANESGKLKRILGTTSTEFGFIDYMQERGVGYDIIGYHNYPHLGENPYRSWSKATPPYDLFQKLASYGKPVHVTEINAGEIYDETYGNDDADGYTQKGYASLKEALTYLRMQKEMNLEEVDIYELLDDPAQKKKAEMRFGLMFNLDKPKQTLSIVRQFSAAP